MLDPGRSIRVAVALCGLAATLACAPADGAVIDLTERFDAADIYVETESIDFGTGPARRHLIDGWSGGDELWANRPEETFVWATGSHASLRFFQLQPQDLIFRFRGRPYAPDGVPAFNQVWFALNGVSLPRAIDIEAGWQDYSIRLSDRFLRIGGNVLTVGFDGPPTVGPSEGTAPRFAFDSVRFAAATVTALPRVERGGTAPGIILPYLSGVDFEVDVDPGAQIRLRGARAYGRPLSHPGTLRVRIDFDDRTESRDLNLPLDETVLQVPGDGGTVRVSFIAMPPEDFYDLRGDAEQDVGIKVIRPSIVLAR